ncbi:hypothetical protein PsYK624_090800 [Phanerochaete sordida]|uniref:Uncharacterized protein n=1 Tax=Phanerochaete sordida TaxID=48140 RepID=A0A9P3LEV6_9APHY|nr:hypothetical protein PsYK624_090800 [Phanerochaete sordida]
MPRELPAGGVLVPQRTYTSERPVQEFEPVEPIRFVVGGKPGIRLDAALQEDTLELEGAGDMIQLPSGGQKIGIRLVWPGYEPWFKYISVSGTAPGQLITKGRFAFEIARVVRQCLQELGQQSSTETATDWWASQVPLEQLVLLELHQVLRSSYQPVLCLIIPDSAPAA